jgi:hypothetical protein
LFSPAIFISWVHYSRQSRPRFLLLGWNSVCSAPIARR